MLECGAVLGAVGTPGPRRPHVAANTGYCGHSGHYTTLAAGGLHKIDGINSSIFLFGI